MTFRICYSIFSHFLMFKDSRDRNEFCESMVVGHIVFLFWCSKILKTINTDFLIIPSMKLLLLKQSFSSFFWIIQNFFQCNALQQGWGTCGPRSFVMWPAKASIEISSSPRWWPILFYFFALQFEIEGKTAILRRALWWWPFFFVFNLKFGE